MSRAAHSVQGIFSQQPREYSRRREEKCGFRCLGCQMAEEVMRVRRRNGKKTLAKLLDLSITEGGDHTVKLSLRTAEEITLRFGVAHQIDFCHSDSSCQKVMNYYII